jgi:hypothetical protein
VQGFLAKRGKNMGSIGRETTGCSGMAYKLNTPMANPGDAVRDERRQSAG